MSYRPALPAERRAALAAAPGFETLISNILAAHIQDYAREAANRSDLKGARRASFAITVDSLIYDMFFNAPSGYRAQYAIDVQNGECANKELVCALAPRLSEFARARGGNERFVETSLHGVGGKVWIDEQEVQSQFSRNIVEIDFERWERNSEDGAGLFAPRGNRLVVNGAWVDGNGTVILDERKLCRSRDIHDRGFS